MRKVVCHTVECMLDATSVADLVLMGADFHDVIQYPLQGSMSRSPGSTTSALWDISFALSGSLGNEEWQLVGDGDGPDNCVY